MDKIITFSFCDSFVDKLGEHIKENYVDKGADLSRVAIVFGGKRPSLFVKRDLSRQIKKSFYPPQFFTIDEFIKYTLNKHERFSSTQDLDTCYLLYQLTKEYAPQILKGREPFAQFLPWARELLAFIDQLDLENVDSRRLNHIQTNAEIGYDVPEDINRLLESVVTLREAYHKTLKDKRLFSRGLQYLYAAEAINKIEFDEFDQILFCNFFYFNRSEEMIVKSLYRRDKATLIFQGDQRRWPVLDKITKDFNCSIKEGAAPETPAFNLNLHAGFDTHSQIGLVREILEKIDRYDKTVIVLPHADHIIPLLSEVTHLIKDFNISMGYPLKRSSLYSLFEFIFRAQLSRKRQRYYTKDYLKVLRHPFVKNLKLCSEATVSRILIHKIEEILTGKIQTVISGSLFIHLTDVELLDEVYLSTKEMLERLDIQMTRKDLENVLKEIHCLLFTSWAGIQNFESFADNLGGFLDVFVEKSFLKKYPLNLNIATKMYAIKDQFKTAVFNKEHFELEEIFRIFETQVSREIVAFIGSPLKGLQILGLFETRSLNFDNVIVLDVNEGVLPKLNVYEPLIPREVMISLSLDRLELEEEIQRYQFMRLISSAKNVHLVYQESKDKEKSRFVEELIWEEQKKLQTLDAVKTVRPNFNVKVASNRISVRKTSAMVEFLKNFTYSASSINSYLRNPLDFYYNYVLGLRESEDLLDEPEARHVGTFLHELLDEAFKPFLHKKPKIDHAFRNRVAKIFETKFDDIFGRSMKSDAFLMRSVLLERLNRFLDNEQHNAERQIQEVMYLENRFEDVISLPVGDIKFKYIVDRIDRLQDGTIMIVDYKTGSVDQLPRSIDHINRMELSRENIRDNIRSFQIPLYFYYLDKQFQDETINAALYNLRTLNVHRFIDQRMSYSREQINEAFLRSLNFIIDEILDPEKDFIEEEG